MKTKRTKRTKKPAQAPTINPTPGITVYERFDAPSTFHLDFASEPTCFNSHLRLRKVKITVEVLDEPKEVLIERLRSLWRKCDNTHHWGPMKYAASVLGIELSFDDCGADLKNK